MAFKPSAPPSDPGWVHFARWSRYRSEFLAEAAEWISRKGSPAEQERSARDLCAQLVLALWRARTDPAHKGWIPSWKPCKTALGRRIEKKAREAAAALHGLSVVEAAYLVSSLYTALLPVEIRSSRGAFYTPPALAERLIDLVAGEGIDWFSVRVLDPACGGGVFLAPLARRILNDHRGLVAENHVNVLRLSGGDPVSGAALAAVLNTRTVDQVFRCISGSVAVSASELLFAPRFLTNPAVILLSESARKMSYFDEEVARAIGLRIEVSGTLPDIVLVDLDAAPPLLVFVECVASDGPVTEQRRKDLEQMAQVWGFKPSGCAFVTVFRDRSEPVFSRTVSTLAWGSFAWFTTEPEAIFFLDPGDEKRAVAAFRGEES